MAYPIGKKKNLGVSGLVFERIKREFDCWLNMDKGKENDFSMPIKKNKEKPGSTDLGEDPSTHPYVGKI